MEANLTRYDIWAEGDRHESELIVEQSESGEWVKFADVKESLSKSHNTGSPKLPTLAEVEMEVQRKIWRDGLINTSFDITELVYNFIGRQLRASA